MWRRWFVLLLLPLVLLGAGCREKARAPLAGVKVLLVIAPGDFRDEELFRTKEALERLGAGIAIASATTEEVRGMLGAKVKPDLSLDEVEVADYASVVFIGGVGARVYWDDPRALGIAREAHRRGLVLGAICIAPVILANAGLLQGLKATCFPSVASLIREKGAIYTGADVEVDDDIVTASGPQAAKEFGEKIGELLSRKGG